tara:strand:- start:19 stop:309 length:291 start_codon:yes stop_codon:yes gene_type:complete
MKHEQRNLLETEKTLSPWAEYLIASDIEIIENINDYEAYSKKYDWTSDPQESEDKAIEKLIIEVEVFLNGYIPDYSTWYLAKLKHQARQRDTPLGI